LPLNSGIRGKKPSLYSSLICNVLALVLTAKALNAIAVQFDN